MSLRPWVQHFDSSSENVIHKYVGATLSFQIYWYRPQLLSEDSSSILAVIFLTWPQCCTTTFCSQATLCRCASASRTVFACLSMFACLQGDLWQWYLEPSLYGTEVVTLGGSRGPSVSYYVPYLSAMQLLLPMPCQEVAAQQQPAAATISFSQPQQSETSLQESDDSSNRLQQRPDIQEQAAAEPGEGHQQPTSGTVDGLPRAGRVYQVEADWQSGPTQVCL